MNKRTKDLLIWGGVLGGATLLGHFLLKREEGEQEPYQVPFDDRDDFITQAALAYDDAGATPLELSLLVAHSALATGFGRNVWNYNIGVLKASGAYLEAGEPWVWLWGEENVSGVLVPKRMRWRAYTSLAQSARDLLEVLGADRYQEARILLEKGDKNWYSALGHSGFYTHRPVSEHVLAYVQALGEVNGRLG